MTSSRLLLLNTHDVNSQSFSLTSTSITAAAHTTIPLRVLPLSSYRREQKGGSDVGHMPYNGPSPLYCVPRPFPMMSPNPVQFANPRSDDSERGLLCRYGHAAFPTSDASNESCPHILTTASPEATSIDDAQVSSNRTQLRRSLPAHVHTHTFRRRCTANHEPTHGSSSKRRPFGGTVYCI
ncbi:hypothetical protein BC826DRAFT_1034115 [Russula brevipes]|nr:hypothetical protein BC826DRAFT_1034115 [Russula brevipes]